MKVAKAYLLVFAHLLVGLILVVSVDQFKKNIADYVPVILLGFFLAINLAETSFFKIQDQLRTYWYPNVRYFFLALIAGAIIGILPGLLFEIIAQDRIVLDVAELSVSGAVVTLVIVAWEELWFRGLILNIARRNIPAISLSLSMGALFMAMHLFNPEISLVKNGPALFFAGALLTTLYFYYRTIWVPLGLHFGNNFFNSLINLDDRSSIAFLTDGYISALILALLFLFFTFRSKRISLETSL